MKFATRLSNLPPYLFVEVNKRLAAKRAEGMDVLDFGMGDPDVPTPANLLDTMCEAIHHHDQMRYPNYFGMPKMRQAISDWYRRRFGVTLDRDREVLPLIGSKEGIAHMAVAMLDPGEIALVPDPGYPAYQFGTLLADGVPYMMPLLEKNGFLPDLDAIPAHIAEKAVIMWLNYPNNPTGATCDMNYLEQVVAFARKHDIGLCFDNAYSEIYYDDYCPPSILQIPGAKEVAVEFNSLSKAYSLAGARIGMVVGNERMIEALGRVKSNIDSGIFNAVQTTAIAALEGDQSWMPARNAIYQRRRDLLVPALCKLGLEVQSPKASLYLWGKVPKGYNSWDFSFGLLDRTGVFFTPGSGFGPSGEGYFRLSLTVPDALVEQALLRLEKVRF